LFASNEKRKLDDPRPVCGSSSLGECFASLGRKRKKGKQENIPKEFR